MWREVAAGLRESGAEAYPVTLSGMGDGGGPAGPDTDLETHIADLVRLIDELEAPEVVLVGHCYGIHPVLGAADRRPQRIARVVHLDVGVPQDGDPALELVPDQELRDRLRAQADPAGDDWRIPPPSPDEWERWGSTAGVPAESLAELARRAVPQPRATLTQPLQLKGTAAEFPVTGVLCTANGSSIALVQTLVGLGGPPPQGAHRPPGELLRSPHRALADALRTGRTGRRTPAGRRRRGAPSLRCGERAARAPPALPHGRPGAAP